MTQRQNKKPYRLRLALAVALPALLVGTVFLPHAFAHRGFGGPFGGCAHGGFDSEHARERLTHMSERLLSKVDATQEQEAAVASIIASLVPQMGEFHSEGQALRKRLREVLSAEKVDAGQAEAIRREAIELADKASRSGLDALLQVGQTLTAQQRQELVETWGKRRHRPQE